MKKFITLFVILCFSVVCYAEHDYLPFLKQGKKWVTNIRTYQIEGDTLIDGTTFMKIYATDKGNGTYYYGCANETEKRVSVVYKDSIHAELIYDFGAAPQEKIFMSGGDVAKRLNEQEIEVQIEGYLRDVMEFVVGFKISEEMIDYYRERFSDIPELLEDLEKEIAEGGPWEYRNGLALVVEGIGGKGNPFRPLGESDGILLSCEEDGKVVFLLENWDWDSMQSTGIHNSQVISNDSYAPAYDLQGRRVAHPRQGEIYIQNGKKYINK